MVYWKSLHSRAIIGESQAGRNGQMSLSSALSSHPPAQALAWPYLVDEAFLGKLKKIITWNLITS